MQNIFASDPFILVTNKGETFKVYKLDITSDNYVYFSLEDLTEAPIVRMHKADILIIRNADGITINSTELVPKANRSTSFNNNTPNPNAHEPIEVRAMEDDFVIIKVKDFHEPQKFILIEDGLNNILNARLLSADEKRIAIAKPRKGQLYNYDKIIIPETVNINQDIYTITEIDQEAFFKPMSVSGMRAKGGGDRTLKYIVFPSTLKVIGAKAFMLRNNLENVILPDSLEEIGERAFFKTGYHAKNFILYVPLSVKYIGYEAFEDMGPKRSPRGFFQGRIDCIPDWITENNCHDFGIDEDAIEDYEHRIGTRK